MIPVRSRWGRYSLPRREVNSDTHIKMTEELKYATYHCILGPLNTMCHVSCRQTLCCWQRQACTALKLPTNLNKDCKNAHHVSSAGAWSAGTTGTCWYANGLQTHLQKIWCAWYSNKSTLTREQSSHGNAMHSSASSIPNDSWWRYILSLFLLVSDHLVHLPIHFTLADGAAVATLLTCELKLVYDLLAKLNIRVGHWERAPTTPTKWLEATITILEISHPDNHKRYYILTYIVCIYDT